MDRSEKVIWIVLVLLATGLVVFAVAGGGRFLGAGELQDPFDKSRVATVRIVIADKDWQWISSNPRAEEYVRGDFWFDGKRYPNVAIRPKGMSSLMSVRGNSKRLPLKVDFNFFNSARSFCGLRKVSLNNGFSDPTFIREMLGYELFEQMDIPTPRCCFVDLYVNKDHLGLYTMVEPIDKAFLRRHFSNPNGNLYKPEMGACNLNWTREDYEKQNASRQPTQQRQQTDALAINMGGSRLSDLLRLIQRESGLADTNAGNAQAMGGPGGFGGGLGGFGGPMGGGPGGFGEFSPAMFIVPQILSKADKDTDQKLTKEEFVSLGDVWFGQNSQKTAAVNQEQFTEKLNEVIPPPQGFGFGGGGPALGPAMLWGPVLFGIMDADKDGAMTRIELIDTFTKWYEQWDTDKIGALSQEKFRDGLNSILPPPQFGAGGFGGPGPMGGGFGGGFADGPMGRGGPGAMGGGSISTASAVDILLMDPDEFEARMNRPGTAAGQGTPAGGNQNAAGFRGNQRASGPGGGFPPGSMGPGGPGGFGGGPMGGGRGGPGGGGPGGLGPMGMFGGDMLEMMGLKTNENYANHSALFRFLEVLNKCPDETFAEEIENVLDVDQVLRFFAVSVVSVHLDNYLGMGHNYYLYEREGKFTILPWDLNMAFGTFGGGPGGGGIDFFIDEPVTGSMEDRPLVKRLLAHTPYRERYHAYLAQVLEGGFAEGKIESRIDELVALVRPYVEKDETKFVTMEQFEKGINDTSDGGDLMGSGGMGPFGFGAPGVQLAVQDLPGDLPDDLAIAFAAARSTGGGNRRMEFGRGGPGGGGPPGMSGPTLKPFIAKRRVSVREQLEGKRASKLTAEQRQQQNQRWPMMFGPGGMR